MANARVDDPSLVTGSANSDFKGGAPMSVIAQYTITVVLVALAAFFAFIASQVVPASGLTLIFVLPVVIASAVFGWGPSLAAIVASLFVFDFFFTEPYFSLRINDPGEIWAGALLLITAAIVSAVTWQSRQRAFEARRAAEQADALRLLAHAVIQGAPRREIVQAAAMALSRIFAAPATALSATDGEIRVDAVAGGATLSDADKKAAESALTTLSPVRGETYPHDLSKIDFWPVVTTTGCRLVLGVDFSQSAYERTADPDRFIEIVGAYLATSLAPASR